MTIRESGESRVLQTSVRFHINILLALIPGITSHCSWNSSPSLTYMFMVMFMVDMMKMM